MITEVLTGYWTFQISDIELLVTSLSFLVTAFVGLVVYFNNRRSWTNRFFFLLALVFDFYIVVNYFSLHPPILISEDRLFWIRLTMFAASFKAPILFFFVEAFPGKDFLLKKRYVVAVIILMFASAAISLSPYLFTSLNIINNAPVPVAGPGILIFILNFVGLLLLSIFVLVKKYHESSGDVKTQRLYLLLAILFSFSSFGLALLIFVVIFHLSSFVFLAPVFLAILMVPIGYSILRHRLFDIKVIAANIFIVVLLIVLLAKTIISKTSLEGVTNGIVLLLAVTFGALLIQGVRREVEQREYIQILANDLSRANNRLRELDRQKSEFISIASHQLRSPLTAIRGYASNALEESYGKLPEGVRDALHRIADSSYQMMNSVEDFLNVSRIEQGRMKYDLAVFDLGATVQAVVHELLPVAQKKRLGLTFEPERNRSFNIKGDEGKIRQVITNIVDNCIKYTPKGSVHVALIRTTDNTLLTTVKDTGIGMSKETISRLFGKYVRAEDASRTNVGGTGLGLYVAKQFVEAHDGKIWAESPGEGKGSSFFVELKAV